MCAIAATGHQTPVESFVDVRLQDFAPLDANGVQTKLDAAELPIATIEALHDRLEREGRDQRLVLGGPQQAAKFYRGLARLRLVVNCRKRQEAGLPLWEPP